MKTNRRKFLGAAASTGALTLTDPSRVLSAEQDATSSGAVTEEALEAAATRPVLKKELFKDAVVIESIDVFKRGRDYLIRVRSKDGAEGISVDNGRADILHPILTRLVAPCFINKDARDLDELLFAMYRQGDNYKYQGLALWCPVAMVEFAILDMLGRIANKPIGGLFGEIIRTNVPFYVASGRRDTTPAQEIDYLKGLVETTGARAIKYRVGGRMSRNADAMPGRTETLIPLTRKVFGDKMAIHADSNSSYDPEHAIPVGRMLEDINAVYFEEPCPFDDFDQTKRVKEALKIPIALGEQESSQARFRSMIQHEVADIVQPDLFYYGGLVRSIRVARMAALRDLPTTCHLSGGFGFVYSLHFASCVPNIGPWQEYKQGVETYGKWFDPPLKIVDGELIVPTGPGVGIADPSDLLKTATAIKA